MKKRITSIYIFVSWVLASLFAYSTGDKLGFWACLIIANIWSSGNVFKAGE